MSDFADVERFAREHAACGGLTPSAMPRPGGGGYLLTLTCTCGATFDRWVSPEDARRPLPIPSRTTAPRARTAAPATTTAPPAPTPTAPTIASPGSTRPVTDTTPLGAVEDVASKEPAATDSAAPATPVMTTEAPVLTPPAPSTEPPAAEAPPTAAAVPPPPPAVPTPPPALIQPSPQAAASRPSRGAASSKPRPRPSEELEALVREALAAEETSATAPTASAAAPAEPVAAGAASRPAGRTRNAPERLNLDTTIRSALQQQADLARPAERPRRESHGRLVWLALFIIVGLGAAAAIYIAGGPNGGLPVIAASPGGSVPRAGDPQRAALQNVVKSLRELHSVATSTTSVSVYSTRVTGAKVEAERYLAAHAPGANRARVREALDIHLLAVSAWRAKSLDQKEAWEAVGLDPSIDLCPPLRLVADFATQPESVSRAQARGAAVASALPLLWECANERIAALEQTLAGR